MSVNKIAIKSKSIVRYRGEQWTVIDVVGSKARLLRLTGREKTRKGNINMNRRPVFTSAFVNMLVNEETLKQ